jgi:hypothetical protein
MLPSLGNTLPHGFAFSWMVGNAYLGITSGLPVISPELSVRIHGTAI